MKEVEIIEEPVVVEPFLEAVQAVKYNMDLLDFEVPEMVDDLYNKAVNLNAQIMTKVSDKNKTQVPFKRNGFFNMPEDIDLSAADAMDFPLICTSISEEIHGKYDNAPKDTAASRVATVLDNHMKLIKDPMYVKYIKENPFYSTAFQNTFVSFPEPYFQTGVDEKNEPVYTKDMKKFEKMMQDYNFLKLIEKSQKFFMEETIPYVKAKEEGKLTQKQAEDYKKKFLGMLESQKKMGEDFNAINETDPLIQTNKTFQKNSDLLKSRWQEPMGTTMPNNIMKIQSYLGNGWTPRDYGLLVEIINWHDTFLDKSVNSKTKKENKNAVKDMKEAYDALFTKKIISLEDRKTRLKNFKAFVEKYDKSEYAVKPLSAMIDDAINAKVPTAEIGLTFRSAYTDEIDDAYNFSRANTKRVPKFDINAMEKQVKHLYKILNDVDYFMFGKSSPQFNEMMTSMKELKNYVSDMKEKKGNDPTLQNVEEFADLVVTAKAKVIKYLDHKAEDFDRDGARRDSDDKQKREQPRIQTSIKLLEELSAIDASNEKIIEEQCIESRKEKYNDLLSEEEKIRSNPNTSANEYKASLIRSFNLIQKSDPRILKKQSNDTYVGYGNKMEVSIKKPTLKEVSAIYNGSKELKGMVKSIMPGADVPKNDDGSVKKVTTEEIRNIYNDKVKEIAVAKKDDSQKLNQYKDNLVSKNPNNKIMFQK